jgi:hypothetical protein
VSKASSPFITKALILDRLASVAEPAGMQLLPHLNQFRGATPTGFQTLIASVSPYGEACVLEIHLGIRLDEVENIVFSFTNGLPGFRNDSMTLVTSMARLAARRFWRFELQQPGDLSVAVAAIAQFMSDTGYAFLEQHRSPEQMAQTLQDDQHRSFPLVSNAVHRCMRSIVLHRLLQRSHFEQLVAAHQNMLQAVMTPRHLQKRYAELATFLRTYSMN